MATDRRTFLQLLGAGSFAGVYNASIKRALAIPQHVDATQLIDAMAEAAKHHAIEIVGGDLSRGDKLVIAVTAIGRATRPLLRSGAKPGDRIYVKAQRIIALDTAMARILSPIERIFGITLLGTSTINQIQGRGNGFNGN